jgi:hypothetical protein
MADTLQDVVQHLTDGAVAQGYMTPEQAAEANATAAGGERPQLDLSAAPQSVRDSAEHVLDQAQSQAQADAARADLREDLNDRWADHTVELNAARSDAQDLKSQLNDLDHAVSQTEALTDSAQAMLDGKPTLGDALTNDNDLQSYRDVMAEVEPQVRPLIDEAQDRIIDHRYETVDMLEHLANSLENVEQVSDDNTALWTEEDAHRFAQAQADQTWTVLQGQADDVYTTASDASAHTEDAQPIHAESAPIEAQPHAADTAATEAHAEAAAL